MSPTIKVRAGVSDRLKTQFDCTTDSAAARALGVDQGQWSRVMTGRSAPGPMFQARMLLAANVPWEQLFEVVANDGKEEPE